MKLSITTPGNSEEIEDTLKNLMKHVRWDLEFRGVPPEEVQRHIYSLSFEMHRVRATVAAEEDGTLIAGYRITR